MTEANPVDRELHLEYSDPFHSPTERLGSEASMRRLFLVNFSCPLCGQEHSCEIYLTMVARNEDEMMEKTLEILGRDDIKVKTLTPFIKEYHQREGDYLQRATAYAKEEVRYPFKVTAVAMTDEESYTCEYCNRKFETIGAWRRHDGRNPGTGGKLAREESIAQCQK